MRTLFLIVFFAVSNFAISQHGAKLYNPSLNADSQINAALLQAQQQHKHILLQVGGNWCGWCIKFNKFVTEDFQLDSVIQKNYVYVHLNYSKENQNWNILERYEYPQRFGFPVLVILDTTGKRLHTQDSGLLESGDGYDKNKVFTFLKKWTSASINPATYKK